MAEYQPQLIGTLAEIQDRVPYPQDAREAGIEGVVLLGSIVDEEGRAVDIEVMRAPTESLGAAAVRALEQTPFRPGLVGGVPVKTLFRVPVYFRLAPADVTPIVDARRRFPMKGVDISDLANGPHVERTRARLLGLLDRDVAESDTSVVQFTLLPDGTTDDVTTVEGEPRSSFGGLARFLVGMMVFEEAQRPQIPVPNLRVHMTYQRPE